MDAKDLLAMFGATEFTFSQNISDVTHEMSLIPSTEGGSSINFLVGHALRSRQSVLELFGAEVVIRNEELPQYVKGEDFSPEKALPLDELTAMMHESFSRMKRAFVKASQDSLDEELSDPFLGQKVTRGRMAGLFSFHEAYHMGQVGLMRRLVGLGGKIQAK
ncbi:DinB family protein [bacterium]|nr:DinB family protein [bacterium]